ncbi:MAG TPA: nuclear transport factor 2 family protein [Terriglobales bacterium]|nr:nuclear transport factor 2 family protein [Terriglobales bacterium]
MISKEMEELIVQKEIAVVAAQQRGDRESVNSVLAENFHEIGSSGRFYSREEILETLGHVKILDYSFDRFQVLPIDGQHLIVTYIAQTRRRYQGQETTVRTYRSSTWQEDRGEWRIVFHQGTMLAA